MTSIPMPEFSRNWQAAIQKLQQGETVVLTDDGKPIAQLTPPPDEIPKEPSQRGLLWMCELGERLIPPGPIESLTNEEMDRIIYDH